MNVCTTCELDFETVAGFDDHRVGTFDYTYREGLDLEPPQYDGRRCLDVDELKAAGWTQNERGRWQRPK